MRPAAVVALATLALVAVGAVEAGESARELAESVGPLRVQPASAGLTGLGLLISSAAYLGLGWWAREDRAAVRLGALTGALAGLVGGSVRAWLIGGAVSDVVARYAAVPGWFVPLVLVVFVVLAALVSSAGGAAIAFAGVRIRRGAHRDRRT